MRIGCLCLETLAAAAAGAGLPARPCPVLPRLYHVVMLHGQGMGSEGSYTSGWFEYHGVVRGRVGGASADKDNRPARLQFSPGPYVGMLYVCR
jgi:hypothetical protein